MQFPILSVIIFVPLIAGLVILLLPAERKQTIRLVALSAGLLDLVLAVIVYALFQPGGADYQFVEHTVWVPALGISYHLGVNGISVPLLLLGAIVLTGGVMVSWNVEDRPREFFAFMMFLGTSVLGVFS